MKKEGKEKRLILLTQFWYEYVGCDHHKDRDCHFNIDKRWSYGKEPIYAVNHFGYMAELEWTEYPTYEEALDALLSWLEGQVKSVYESIPKNWASDTEWDYNWKGVRQVCLKYNLYPLNP